MKVLSWAGHLCAVLVMTIALGVLWWSIGVAQENLPAPAQGSPDWLRLIFDRNAMIAMFAYGLAHKYFPPLAGITNGLINYLQVLAYICTRLIGGAIVDDAHAAVSANTGATILDVGSIVLGGFTNAVWSRQMYEGWARPLLEGLFGWRKAIPR